MYDVRYATASRLFMKQYFLHNFASYDNPNRHSNLKVSLVDWRLFSHIWDWTKDLLFFTTLLSWEGWKAFNYWCQYRN